MASFITLMNFTDQGIRNIKDTTKRYDAFLDVAKNAGVTVKDVYWTLGQYDIVLICDAPDEAAATALLMDLASRGNVRSQTLRGFSRQEMDAIVNKIGS